MSITVTKLVKLFLKHTARQLATEDRAPATLRFYQSRFKWLVTYFVNRKWKSIRSLEILEFLEYAGNGRSARTQRANVRVLKRLQRFAIKHGLSGKPIFGDLKKYPILSWVRT